MAFSSHPSFHPLGPTRTGTHILGGMPSKDEPGPDRACTSMPLAYELGTGADGKPLEARAGTPGDGKGLRAPPPFGTQRETSPMPHKCMHALT